MRLLRAGLLACVLTLFLADTARADHYHPEDSSASDRQGVNRGHIILLGLSVTVVALSVGGLWVLYRRKEPASHDPPEGDGRDAF